MNAGRAPRLAGCPARVGLRGAAAAAALVLAIPLTLRAAPAVETGAPAPEAGPVIASIGAIRFVTSGEENAEGTVFTTARLRGFLEDEVGRSCAPLRVEEAISARYRALGYVPSVRAWCADGVLTLAVRESSHRVGVITFDVADLAPLGVQPQRLSDERQFYPVPDHAPRAVVRGLLQTSPGDLYNVERYRLDRLALVRLGYVLLFIPGAAPEEEQVGEGAYLIQSATPMPEDESRPARRGPLNYLGGSAGYGPRSGGTAGVVYQRRDILTGLDSLSLTPTFSTAGTAWGGGI